MHTYSAAESIQYRADGPIPLCLATSKGPTITEEKSVVNNESDYFASAIVVVPPNQTDNSLSTVEGTVESSPVGKISPMTAQKTISGSQLQTGEGMAATSTDLQPKEPISNNVNSSGLSGGTIAGIAIGVAIPVILAGLYFAYRFRRRARRLPHQRKHQSLEVTAQDCFDNGTEPGISTPAVIGGILSRSQES
ncbi:hypothetical protein ABW20_dc0105534 [Dactylellina cionopaga]|nr:hypothetical protein ABW20_dc0105534 [Dactylellina cionopaga]